MAKRINSSRYFLQPLRTLAWLVSFLIWALAPVDALQAKTTPSEVTVLVAHPRASILKSYMNLARKHILNIQNLHMVGIHHAIESESYEDTKVLLTQEKPNWISLYEVKCPLNERNMYHLSQGCQEEFSRLLENASGIIFNGGPDIPPSFYDAPTLLTTVIETPQRHIFEMALLAYLTGSSRNRSQEAWLKAHPDYPILAICLGMQSMNVAAGGSLIQDIPSKVYGIQSLEEAVHMEPATWHRNYFHHLNPELSVSPGITHPIVLLPQAPLSWQSMINRSPATVHVLSAHHQAIDKVADGFQVLATSADGKVVEALGHKQFPHVVGVQFHPEEPHWWPVSALQTHAISAQEKQLVYANFLKDPAAQAFNHTLWYTFAQAVRLQSHQQKVFHRPHAFLGPHSFSFSAPKPGLHAHE